MLVTNNANNQLPAFLVNKSRCVAKYTKDTVVYFHVGMFDSYTEDYIFKHSGCDVIPISLNDLKTYTFVEDVKFAADNKVSKEFKLMKTQYVRKLKRGKQLCEHLKETDFDEEMLTESDQECVDLYMRYERVEDSIEGMKLKPWQAEVMQKLESPNDRSIIWVYGKRGGEGKTWLQNYIEMFFGHHRVYLGKITTKNETGEGEMQQTSMAFKNIFVFNIAKSESFMTMLGETYRVLEGIKDGDLYLGRRRRSVQTPNTVIVFANEPPEYERLSLDRWSVYKITPANELKLCYFYFKSASEGVLRIEN